MEYDHEMKKLHHNQEWQDDHPQQGSLKKRNIWTCK
jgi:hypothetical protein